MTVDLDTVACDLGPERWEAMYLAHATGERDDTLPFPPETVQRRTNNARGRDTADDAIAIVGQVLELAGSLETLSRGTRVLDFGCGWGRITRLLPAHFDTGNIAGADVDAEFIASANALLPQIEHRLITKSGALPYGDGSFDLLFANSVFSHLDEATHRAAVAEISRVLSPGGIAILSVLDRTAVERFYASETLYPWIRDALGTTADLDKRLEDAGFRWGFTGPWENYGIAVMTEAWATRAWAEAKLNVVSRARGSHKRAQLFLAARKGQAAGCQP